MRAEVGTWLPKLMEFPHSVQDLRSIPLSSVRKLGGLGLCPAKPSQLKYEECLPGKTGLLLPRLCNQFSLLPFLNHYY